MLLINFSQNLRLFFCSFEAYKLTYAMKEDSLIDSRMPSSAIMMQGGNTKAFSTFYNSYIDILFNYGCILTQDRELLKDCIHDVFIKLYVDFSLLTNVRGKALLPLGMKIKTLWPKKNNFIVFFRRKKL